MSISNRYYQIDGKNILDNNGNPIEYNYEYSIVCSLHSLNITKFPDDRHFYLQYVTFIDLSNNKIEELPNDIGKLKKLTHLDLSNNKLSKIQTECLKDIPNLISLDMSNNQITVIPKEIKYLHKLIILDLSNNQIKEIPKEIKYLYKLENFDISNNQIKEISNKIMKYLNLIKIVDYYQTEEFYEIDDNSSCNSSIDF
jgi:Leucine-rich repeat (LRR) protein